MFKVNVEFLTNSSTPTRWSRAASDGRMAIPPVPAAW